MSLQHELLAFHQVTPARLNRFANLIDLEWLEQALHCIGNPLQRRRRLPVNQAIWLVIGFALFRNQPIWHIVQQLELHQRDTPEGPVPSASVGARQRVGVPSLLWLFT